MSILDTKSRINHRAQSRARWMRPQSLHFAHKNGSDGEIISLKRDGVSLPLGCRVPFRARWICCGPTNQSEGARWIYAPDLRKSTEDLGWYFTWALHKRTVLLQFPFLIQQKLLAVGKVHPPILYLKYCALTTHAPAVVTTTTK